MLNKTIIYINKCNCANEDNSQRIHAICGDLVLCSTKDKNDYAVRGVLRGIALERYYDHKDYDELLKNESKYYKGIPSTFLKNLEDNLIIIDKTI